MTDTVAMTIQT